MKRRVPAGLALRFRVLERDNFRCQYCGARAPQAELEVDHITPVSEGGRNEARNLITACFRCNRGKRAGSAHGYAQKAELLSALEKLDPSVHARVTIRSVVGLLWELDAMGEGKLALERAQTVEDWLSAVLELMGRDLLTDAAFWGRGGF